MRLQAEINDLPYLEGDRIKVAMRVWDEESGRAWSLESDLGEGLSPRSTEGALPFDVVKRAEDAVFAYLARSEVRADVRVLREQVIPHALGSTYRPMVDVRHKDGKVEYVLKS